MAITLNNNIIKWREEYYDEYYEAFSKNNKVIIVGQIEKKFELVNYEADGEKYYASYVLVKRKSSEAVDRIPVLITLRMYNRYIKDVNDIEGKWVECAGILLSRNIHDENEKSHLILRMIIKKIKFFDNVKQVIGISTNLIYLKGCICKKPIYRTTPLGKEICDFIIAVNRFYPKCDYLPCIAWSMTANKIKNLQVGDKITFCGRIQSRKYVKHYEEGDEEKETIEISVLESTFTII